MRGVDVLTAEQDEREEADDKVILERATQLGRVLFSQDTDLLAIASSCQQRAIPFVGLIYAHQLGITVGQCVADLEMICKACDAEELRNRVIYLPL